MSIALHRKKWINFMGKHGFQVVLKGRKIGSARLAEFLKFAVVGGSGVGVNMGLLYLLTRSFHIPLEFASPVAIETSILSNFTLNNLWTFRKRMTHVPFWSRLFRYHLVTGLAGAVNYLVLLLLVHLLGINDLVSNLVGIGVGTVINFFLNSLWTWRVQSPGKVSR
jgi:dolichol-phosphate mannosyltransferase